MATVIATDLFNPLTALYGQHVTMIQWNAPYSILLLFDDWLLKQFDIEVLWYSNWHGTSFFPAPQIEFCNQLCNFFFKHFVRMCHFLGRGHPSTNIITATLLYIKYLYWTWWSNESLERRFFFSIFLSWESQNQLKL